MPESFSLPSSAEVIRRRPLRRLVEPWFERGHLYDEYARFLDSVGESGVRVLPLRELATATDTTHRLLGLRHDVDDRLDSALVLAEIEHERGLRATYFVLHTAPYFADHRMLPALKHLQELGHEVGFHSDLVTVQLAHGGDPRAVLSDELARLRGAGIDIVGVAAHGSYWGHKLGYLNDYFFRGSDAPLQGFPNAERVGDVALAKGTLEEFGLSYDAGQLAEAHYWTDSWRDERGRRWHPRLADLDQIAPGETAIVLVHPCHWDWSIAAKARRTTARLARRAMSGHPA